MNSKSVEKASNPLFAKVSNALQRTCLKTQKIAQQTGTAVIISENDQLRRVVIENKNGMVAESPVQS